MLKKNIGKLHVLTDTVLQSHFSHLDLARMAIDGGADTIQFREKSASTREMIEIARKLKGVCVEAGLPFIVNDRVDVALASAADGVHLGQDDFPIPLARELLGTDVIIGGSAVTLEDAQKCLADGADYVGFGPVYPTSSKLDASSPTGIEPMEKAIKTVPLPFIAIGGIHAQNVSEVMQAGAYGIAVISAVCCQTDPEQATRMLSQALGMGD
ncbi:MAG: thiamine phosphate synthase [Candidatus Aminicenantes bacterium]|nr:MAG: thiamine phosphate synthase [Candidatus Aminicenantes bacterium]